MSIRVVNVGGDRKLLRDFINLPWQVYQNDKNWVPPLKISQKELLSSKHPLRETLKMELFVAYSSGSPVGRIAAINNHQYNHFHKTNVRFFGFWEQIEADKELASALFSVASDELYDSESTPPTELIGPVNPSTNYEAGLLVSGFSDPPQVMMTYNPKWYEKLLLDMGFRGARDLFAYRLATNMEMPEKILRIADRVEKRAKESGKISFRKIDFKKFSEEARQIREIYNDAWENNWGFVPMTQKEFQRLASELKLIADPKLIIFAEVNGEAAGVIIGLPDLYQVFSHIPDGNLFPSGIVKLVFKKKFITRGRIPLMGIKRKFQHLGLEALFYREIQKAFLANHYKESELSWILEDNEKMRRPLDLMGAKAYKTYRIYSRPFAMS